MSVVYIGLGSNMGDRVSHIQQALHMLVDVVDASSTLSILNTSSFYETEPVGFKEQEWFVNAVVEIETTLPPQDLLLHCQAIETRLGRVRDLGNPNGPRTIDLDILFYDDQVISTDALIVPHPRLHERSYALVPMLELNDSLIHPIIHQTITQLHQALKSPEEVFLYGTRSTG